jgi:hypothetical protein
MKRYSLAFTVMGFALLLLGLWVNKCSQQWRDAKKVLGDNQASLASSHQALALANADYQQKQRTGGDVNVFLGAWKKALNEDSGDFSQRMNTLQQHTGCFVEEIKTTSSEVPWGAGKAKLAVEERSLHVMSSDEQFKNLLAFMGELESTIPLVAVTKISLDQEVQSPTIRITIQMPAFKTDEM